MLKQVSKEQIIKLIKDRHPAWNDDAVSKDAENIICTLNDVFDPLLSKYIESGEMENYKQGKFSIFLINGLCPENSYLESICMLDKYMKNPAEGTAEIMRH